MAAPRENEKKKKAEINVERRSADNRLFIMPPRRRRKRKAPAQVLFSRQSEAAGIPALSLIAAAHIARKRLINHVQSLITFHCKQAKDAFVS